MVSDLSVTGYIISMLERCTYSSRKRSTGPQLRAAFPLRDGAARGLKSLKICSPPAALLPVEELIISRL
jgi:hypothetical protein